MTRVTQPLRDEHKELIPHVERLRAAADSVGNAPLESVLRGVDDAYGFLVHHLMPHAEAEDRALYPVVARLMGTSAATATMTRDHAEVARLTAELGSIRSRLSGATLDDVQARALRRVLYGLHALITVHFAKEEEIYLPLLDERLSPTAARDLFEAMEVAALRAKADHAHEAVQVRG